MQDTLAWRAVTRSRVRHPQRIYSVESPYSIDEDSLRARPQITRGFATSPVCQHRSPPLLPRLLNVLPRTAPARADALALRARKVRRPWPTRTIEFLPSSQQGETSCR